MKVKKIKCEICHKAIYVPETSESKYCDKCAWRINKLNKQR